MFVDHHTTSILNNICGTFGPSDTLDIVSLLLYVFSECSPERLSIKPPPPRRDAMQIPADLVLV